MDDLADRRVALRRFTGVLMRGSGLSSVEEVSGVFGSLFKGKGRSLRRVPAGWEVRITEMVHKRSLYPDSMTSKGEASDDGFLHAVYVGSASLRAGAPRRSGWVLLASPYVRLLRDLRQVARNRTDIEFLAPKMERLFSYFEEHRTGLRVPRIVVQMFGDIGVETVALSGRSPLRSDLRQALERVSLPYAIRIADVDEAARPSVSFDKRGQIWWHLRTQDQLNDVLTKIRLVDDIDAFASTSRWPTLSAEAAVKPEA
jgi:hypothetical protein